MIDFAAAPDLVRVEGLPAEDLLTVTNAPPEPEAWQRLLRVTVRDPARTAGDAAPELPALLGRTRIEEGALVFAPRFPPVPGLEIEAHFDGAAWDLGLARARGVSAAPNARATPDASARAVIPVAPRAPGTRVTGIHPAEEVPANLLRFYVYFSGPMSAHQVLPHVELLDSRGDVVPVAFVDVPGGLWDPRRTRLTLFVHPGRIKRGVGPHQVLGPVLEPGRSYRLRIGADARDAAGRTLEQSFELAFTAAEEDHRSPDPAAWKVASPRGPAAPLEVVLAEPADRALLLRLPTVVDPTGAPVAGSREVSPDGRRFVFTPREPWRPGRHLFQINVTLEDPSGNSVGRRFETSSKEGEDGSAEKGGILQLEFWVDEPSGDGTGSSPEPPAAGGS